MKKLVKKYKGFDIYFEALPEYKSLSDMFPDDTPEQLNEIYENNRIFVAKVTAERAGVELASDYLGGCVYEEVEDFYIKYAGDYFADMVETVVEEAEKEVIRLTEELKGPAVYSPSVPHIIWLALLIAFLLALGFFLSPVFYALGIMSVGVLPALTFK